MDQDDELLTFISTEVFPNSLLDDLIHVGGEYCFRLLQQAHAKLESGDHADCHSISSRICNIAWEKIHHGPFHAVEVVWRDLYAAASLLMIGCKIMQGELREAVRLADMGLLLGANAWRDALQQCADVLTIRIAEMKKQKRSEEQSCNKKGRMAMGDLEFVDDTSEEHRVTRLHQPSLEEFQKWLHLGAPVIITGEMTDWPAMQRWGDIEYLKSVFGCRTVPIEIGQNYLQEGWSQRLMTFDEFADKYLMGNGDEIGYLAQHQLFEQIPALAEDLKIPRYVQPDGGNGENDDESVTTTTTAAATNDAIAVNAWLGPKGTVSPLHFDPKHNFLCQIVGAKKLRLVHPKFTDAMYPHPTHMCRNSSQVDLDNVDATRFPLFEKAEYQECVLKPGEMLCKRK